MCINGLIHSVIVLGFQFFDISRMFVFQVGGGSLELGFQVGSVLGLQVGGGSRDINLVLGIQVGDGSI